MTPSSALDSCPFLKEVAKQQGYKYARSIAVNPFVSAPAPRRPLLEETEDFEATFRLFHGPSSPVPLPRDVFSSAPIRNEGYISDDRVGELTGAKLRLSSGERLSSTVQPRAELAQFPFAAMSLGFNGLPDFGILLKQLNQRMPRSRPLRRKPLGPEPKIDSSRAATGPQQLSKPASQGSPASGGCPLKKMMGPFAGVVFSGAPLHCPEPIIKARAFLASTTAVRTLRPQALPVKLAAVGLAAATLNVPCGIWREHTKKFSLEWVFAVHATIPFIAMLRKAVIMPKYAIVFTILTAVAGQAIGARMERERMQRMQRVPVSMLVVAACSEEVETPVSCRVAHCKRAQRTKKMAPMIVSEWPVDPIPVQAF